MKLSRKLRFPADRSQLIIVFGAALIVVALFGFAELAVQKNAALAANQQAQAVVDRLEEQNRLLKSTLEQARMGERVAPKAWEYFDEAAPGVTLIQPEEPASPEPDAAAPPSDDRPAWLVRMELTWDENFGRIVALLDELVVAAERRLQP